MASCSLGTTTTRVIGAQVEVVLPKDLIDTTLFLDLLDYILPAGMTCRIIRKTEEKRTVSNIELRHKDTITWMVSEDLDWIEANTKAIGLSSMFELENPGITDYTTANIKKIGNNLVLNTGLLDNTVIPVLDYKFVQSDDGTVYLYSTEKDGTHLKLLAAGGVQLKAKKHYASEDDDAIYLYSTEGDGTYLKLLAADGTKLEAEQYYVAEDSRNIYLLSSENNSMRLKLLATGNRTEAENDE
jgi:hypothetical protein